MDEVSSAAQPAPAPDEVLDVAGFLGHAAGVVAQRGLGAATFAELGRLMWRLDPHAAAVARDELVELHRSGAASTILAEGTDGSVLVLGRFPPDAPTPVHNHNTWGVLCVIEGRDRYVAWRRLDDGSDPHHADIEVLEERELGPGDVVWFDSPPQDVHSQQGIGGYVWEFAYFGRNPNQEPRAYFDPTSGAVTYASAT